MANITVWAQVGRSDDGLSPSERPKKEVTLSEGSYYAEWGRWHQDEYDFAKIHFFADPGLEMMVLDGNSLTKLRG